MAIGFLNSNSLIDTIKREAFIPSSQNTFTNADFWAIANQEIRIGLMPSIMQYHQEYYVRDSDPIPLVANQNAYPIPYRAAGGKFRDIYFKDTNGNLRSMTRISPDDRPYYQQTNFQNRFIYFMIQGNEVVLLPDVGSNPVGFIVFSFYIRPNELVDVSRVSTIQSISTTTQNGVISAISTANPVLITSTAHGLTTGNVISISGSNSNSSIDGAWKITVTDANHFSIPTAVVSVAGTQGSWTYNTTTFTVDQIPQNLTPFLQNGNAVTGFTTSTLLDVMQTNPGHKTISFDKKALTVDTTNKLLTFNTVDVTSSVVPGDYISFSGECIIPQIPSDLHDILAQRVGLRCLQSLGDVTGVQTAQGKLAEMEKYTGMLIDNRSEGEPVKVNNLKGLLRSAKVRKRGWL